MLVIAGRALGGRGGRAHIMTPVQFILFMAVAYSLVLVYQIVRHTHPHQAERRFAWLVLSTAAWNACVAIMQFPALQPIALWLARATFFIAVFMCWSGLWFSVYFPRMDSHFRKLAVLFTWLGVPWLFLAWTKWIVPEVKSRSWGVEVPGLNNVAWLFTAWLLICIVAIVMHTLVKSRTLRGLERQRVRYILLGIIGLAIAGIMTNLILPLISRSNPYAPLGGLSSLFLTTSTTYAIVRYRLLDIKVIFRAGVIYLATIGLLSLCFAAMVPLLEHTLTRHLELSSGIGSICMAFVIALAFQPMRHEIQRLVDLRFFKSIYDFRTALRAAGHALASATSQEMLLNMLKYTMDNTLHPRSTAVFLPNGQQAWESALLRGQWDNLPARLDPLDAILHHARASDDVLLTDELIHQHDDVQQDLGERLQTMSVALTVPLVAGGKLNGIIFLGEKMSGDMYTTEDIGLLRVLSTQAAVAMNSVQHYEEILRMNEYHARLINIAQEGVIAIDPQCRVITFNAAAERMLGMSFGEVLGKPLQELGISLTLDLAGEQEQELTITTRAGQKILVQITLTPFTRRWEVEESHLLILHDMTALRQLEQQKVQAERFASMGAMAASLAHEIKNPLVPIKTFAHLLPSRYDDAEFRQEFSQLVVNEVERIDRLIGQMVDLVRKSSTEKGQINLSEMFERLLALIRPQCERQQITVQVEIADDLPMISGQDSQLYQSFLNVLTNAMQAMPEGGKLMISLQVEGERICCRIADSGPGVQEDILPHIFELLFTTRPGGHGLGLALAYQFIQANGGEIRAESHPGSGLLMIVELPVWHPQEAEV